MTLTWYTLCSSCRVCPLGFTTSLRLIAMFSSLASFLSRFSLPSRCLVDLIWLDRVLRFTDKLSWHALQNSLPAVIDSKFFSRKLFNKF